MTITDTAFLYSPALNTHQCDVLKLVALAAEGRQIHVGQVPAVQQAGIELRGLGLQDGKCQGNQNGKPGNFHGMALSCCRPCNRQPAGVVRYKSRPNPSVDGLSLSLFTA